MTVATTELESELLSATSTPFSVVESDTDAPSIIDIPSSVIAEPATSVAAGSSVTTLTEPPAVTVTEPPAVTEPSTVAVAVAVTVTEPPTVAVSVSESSVTDTKPAVSIAGLTVPTYPSSESDSDSETENIAPTMADKSDGFAHIQQSSSKVPPILTEGTITPEILHRWERACLNYFRHKKIKADVPQPSNRVSYNFQPFESVPVTRSVAPRQEPRPTSRSKGARWKNCFLRLESLIVLTLSSVEAG